MLEIDEVAELAKLLSILVATECGEHPSEVALRRDCRSEPMADGLTDRRSTQIVVAARAGRDRDRADGKGRWSGRSRESRSQARRFIVGGIAASPAPASSTKGRRTARRCTAPATRPVPSYLATGDIYATQQLLGHADVSTTANIYVQGSSADLEAKLRKVWGE